jgi:uncharacterized protein (UPF0297 family)
MRAKVVENTHFFVVKQRHHADVDAWLVEVYECLRRNEWESVDGMRHRQKHAGCMVL